MDEKKNKKTKGKQATPSVARRIVPIVLFALAVFTVVCFITPESAGLSGHVGGFLLGLFSAGGYLVPALLAVHAIFFSRDLTKKRLIPRIIFSVVVLLAFSSFMHAISSIGQDDVPFSVAKFYENGKDCVGGGFFGGLIAYGLMKVIGPVGIIILAVLVFAIYLTCFFASGRATLAKLLLALLDKISDTVTKAAEKRRKKREEKEMRAKDKRHPRISPKHEDLYEDEFFSVDNGMSEIRIDELGIRETRKQSDLEKMPHLEEKVFRKSEIKENPDNIFVDEDEYESEPIIIEDVEEMHEDAVRESTNDSAEAVFTKDFDPFDFEENARISAIQAQKAKESAMKFNEYAEPITVKTRNFSQTEINEARERDEFERRKRMMLEAEERRRALEEEERKQEKLREILREEEPERKATYTSYSSAASRDYGYYAKKEEPSPTADKSDASTVPKESEHFETERPTYQQTAAREEYASPTYRAEATAYENASPVQGAAPSAPAPEAPAYNPEPRPYEPINAKPYEPTPEPEFKEYTVPAYEEIKTNDTLAEEDMLKISREPITQYIGEEFDEEEAELEQADINAESFNTFTPTDDEVSYPEDPIPPEKQNPVINEYRGMFTVFSEEKEERHEALVVTNDEPLQAEREYYGDESAPFEPTKEADDGFDNIQPIIEAKPAPVREEKRRDDGPDYSNYKLPPLDLLKKGNGEIDPNINEEIERNGEKLIDTLAQFNVKASIRSVDVGPRITRYEIVPAKGVRVNSVINLFDDIALNLAAEGIRMEAPIPGRSAIGVEIPNKNSQMVFLRELLETDEFKNATSTTMACFGKDVTGNPVLGDIAKMPHMLIAGATGMGKSVCINALILSMLFRSRPDELKFIMIDPKMVEFNSYNGIPHLLIPVIIDVKQAAGALMWAVEQMEKRYEMFLEYSVKNLDGYNAKLREMGEKPLSKIIIIIDELADLMLQARKPVEDLIMRIAQKARAAGIHLIIGTQRPSVDIITGVIKANIPSRISCKVSSFQDSKTILEQAGAEKLLNNGDMLFWPVGKPKPTRVQGAFVSDKEVENVMEFLKKQNKGNSYDEQALSEINSAAQKCTKGKGSSMDDYDDDGDGDGDTGYFNDPQFLKALEVAVSQGKIATSLIQRKLGIGYSKAAKFIDIMQEQGFVSEPNGQKAREVLITRDELHEILARRSLD